MITKQEITSLASSLKLLPTTVEKDYVLSWILYGVSKHPKLSHWLFKGGTCLKKCYFETYRFSEDLDFTVPPGAIYEKNDIREALIDISENIYQDVGINFKTEEIEVKESVNKKNNVTYIAKLTYAGPLNLPSRSQQRVKFDITNDEIIVDTPDIRPVFHPYSDRPEIAAKVNCYSVNEIIAEKTRAIYERQGRARDIYDIVNISRSFREHVDIHKARWGVKEKFKFKSLAEPSAGTIFSRVNLDILRAGWEDQLKHQLQLLPPVESFYSELHPSLSWWMEDVVEPVLPTISSNSEEKILPRSYFPEIPARRISQFESNHLTQIRYAARNRLCVEIEYHGIKRLAEPYSLRQPRTGNLLLYVFELKKIFGGRSHSIKAYKVSEITGADVTQQIFLPRYTVEL